VKWFSSTQGAAVSLTTLGFIYGVLWVYFYRGDGAPQVVVVIGILISITVFIWFREDAFARFYNRSPFLNVAVIALPIVAVPFYLFRSRGFKGGIVATLVGLLIFVAFTLSSWLGSMLASSLRT
jgi:hypothetical protein